ncbi:phosphatidate cytidylyltransferase [Nesterenkonia sphaerica]|uniref:Phosphatidate cytidylyltransferase n=1 Tax=Nesterenkonia sphaerica TaxID=1804988 RepID=A0A5R9A5C4_9MICC|nr:phosphatidate cytidylyltransferase [Nesterenkonia sphaerica]TLP73255.1 phosphatidate cytidylyltransferase [Nesterenkonia sphaerica]
MSDWEFGLLDSSALGLLGGVLGALVLASVIAWILGRKMGATSTIRNLKQRINAWWLMVALIGAVLAAGETLTILLFLVLSLLALREFITISPTGRADHKALVWLVFILPPLHYWFLWEHWYGMFSVFIPVYAFLFLPARNALAGETKGFLQRAATIQWALMVCVYAISHAPALLQLPVAMELGREAAEGSAPGAGGATGAHLLLFLLIVVQGSDVLQYAWGKALGRHPIAPSVSPNKTWEGFIGGVLSATAIGAALWWITPFSPLMAAALALISCVMGFAGGLVMSAIKRDRGIKDFGSTIPGHGGIMDRLDSLCFAAPVFFHAVRFLYA